MKYIFEKYKRRGNFLHIPNEVVRKFELRSGDKLILKDVENRNVNEYEVIRMSGSYYIRATYKESKLFEVINIKRKEN